MYQNYGGIKVFRPITFRELVRVGEVGGSTQHLIDDTSVYIDFPIIKLLLRDCHYKACLRNGDVG